MPTNGPSSSIPVPIAKSFSTEPMQKTPADEGIEFFQSAVSQATPIRVYELRLDSDGGPNRNASVEPSIYFW